MNLSKLRLKTHAFSDKRKDSFLETKIRSSHRLTPSAETLPQEKLYPQEKPYLQ